MSSVVGKTFARLTVLAECAGAKWLCECSCGKRKTLQRKHVISGATRSCGCLRADQIAERNTTHGHCNHPLWLTWVNMMGRCHDPKHPNYEDYGARRISVCERWRVFENFINDVGTRPSGHTLEREDNNLGYQPGNVVWATTKTQANNKRSTIRLTFKGVTRPLEEWCRELSINRSTAYYRLKRGWSDSEALTGVRT